MKKRVVIAGLGETGLLVALGLYPEFDVIGISVGNETRLDWLTNGISSVRRASLNQSIGVMVGGPIFREHPEYVALVGADATAVDGRHAPALAESLLDLRTALKT